jgi:iron-sulfur cluster assembly protein
MTVIQYLPKQNIEIHCTPAANARLIKVIDATQSALGMRLSVKKTGCSGYSYVLEVVTKAPADDFMLSIDEKHFLFVDKKSYSFLEGLKIDYVKQGLQAKFTYENPKQTGQCGCGESFSVK